MAVTVSLSSMPSVIKSVSFDAADALAKNRMHFDLRAPGTVEEEVARLERLGATVLCRHAHNSEMADPEGNVFCVEPGPRAA
jgi:Glyoxalase-like domain